MPPELISFINFKPTHLTDFKPTREVKNSASPRTINHVGKMINTGLDKDLESEVFTGAAGEAFAIEFGKYLEIYRDLPEPRQILANPTTSKVPTELSQKFAVSGALAHAVTDKTFENFIVYMERMPIEFHVSSMRDAIAKQTKLLAHKSFAAWSTKYGATMMASRK